MRRVGGGRSLPPYHYGAAAVNLLSTTSAPTTSLPSSPSRRWASSSSPSAPLLGGRVTLSQHILATAHALKHQVGGATNSNKMKAAVLPPSQLLAYAIAQREVDTVLSMRTLLLHKTASDAVDAYYKAITDSTEDAEALEIAKTQLSTTLLTFWDQLITAASQHGQIEAHSTLFYEASVADRDFLELTGGVVARSQRHPSTSDGAVILEMVHLYRTFCTTDAKTICDRQHATTTTSSSFETSTTSSSNTSNNTHPPHLLRPGDLIEAPLDFISKITKGVKGIRSTISPHILKAIVEACLGTVIHVAPGGSRLSEDDICAVVASLLDVCMEVAKTQSTNGSNATASGDVARVRAGRRLAAGALELLHFTLDITGELPSILEQHANPDKPHEVGASDLTVGRIAQLVLEQIPGCYRAPVVAVASPSPAVTAATSTTALRVTELGDRVIVGAEQYQLEGESGPVRLRQFSNVDVQSVRIAMAAAAMRCGRLEGTAPDRLAGEIAKAEQWGVGLEPSVVVERLLMFKEVSMAPNPSYADITPSTQSIVDDTLLLTRSVVENRPRVGAESLSAEFKADYQTVHRLCIEVLVACDAINDAYLTIVTHKYHGLGITKEVISPLVKVLGERGDCRALNLVDLCTLYCGNKIDLAIVGSLFRMCEVAGDHHRAKALLSLLKEVIPGFLAKAPPEVFASLQHLKVPLFVGGGGLTGGEGGSEAATTATTAYHRGALHMFSLVGAGTKIPVSDVPQLHLASSSSSSP